MSSFFVTFALWIIIKDVWVDVQHYITEGRCLIAAELIEEQLIEKTGSGQWWKCEEVK